ncbi:MAG: hypothetical protein OEY05_16800 [Paracoccaceae bacterium]|nr:hypothetical protein [Paracoccaceae bacterium]
MMNFRMLTTAIALAFSLSTLPPANATTVTFDALPDYGTALIDSINTGTFAPYVENGVTVTPTNGLLAWDTAQGLAHVDDSGTDFTSGLMFTMASMFDAVSFSLNSLGYDFLETPGPLSDNIFVTGFSGGSAVATAGFLLSDVFMDVQTFTLGAGFSALDALLIEIVYPTNTALCGAPCGHFDLDTVVLAPVVPNIPVPPAVAMMGAAGLALFGLGMRKRRRFNR